MKNNSFAVGITSLPCDVRIISVFNLTSSPSLVSPDLDGGALTLMSQRIIITITLPWPMSPSAGSRQYGASSCPSGVADAVQYLHDRVPYTAHPTAPSRSRAHPQTHVQFRALTHGLNVALAPILTRKYIAVSFILSLSWACALNKRILKLTTVGYWFSSCHFSTRPTLAPACLSTTSLSFPIWKHCRWCEASSGLRSTSSAGPSLYSYCPHQSSYCRYDKFTWNSISCFISPRSDLDLAY